jgi:drug/metabolite transporter (DMT)-like permease
LTGIFHGYRRAVVRRPELTLAAVCTGWGSIPLVVRQVDLPAPAIVFGRLSIATLGLALALLVTRRRFDRADAAYAASARPNGPGPLPPTALPAPTASQPVRCIIAAAILAGHWVALFAAYQRASSGTVILIVYMAPVAIAALAPRTLGERHTRRTLAALALAAAGFVLVAAPAIRGSTTTTDENSTAGIALAAIAGATFVALILVSKPLAEIYGGLRLAFLEMSGAALCLLPVAVFTAWGSPQPEWAWLIVLGLVHTALGTALYLGALAQVPATNVGILGYLEPAAVVVLAWLVLHERPGPSTIAGGALIVLGGWLTIATEVPARVPR